MKVSFENKIRLGFGSGLIFLLLISGAGYWSARRSLRVFQAVEHTEQSLDLLRGMLASMLDVETAVRGFLITGNQRLLVPFEKARAETPQLMRQLRQAAKSRPEEQRDLAGLDPLIASEFSYAAGMIDSGTRGHSSAAAQNVAAGNEQKTLDAIRARIATLESLERKQLTDQSADAQATIHDTLIIIGLSGGLALLVVGAAGGMARRDFTRRLQAEKELEESEERFRMMVDGVKDYAILRLDADGRVVSWNTGAERIIGYRPEEIVGQHFSRFYPPEDIQTGKPDRVLAVAAAEGRYEAQERRVRKEGSQFWASVLITALRDDTGHLRGFVKITQDITARRRGEEEIMKLNADLKGHAAQVEAANQELEAFSFSVSHDLRAPLRHIDGFVNRLQTAAGTALDERGRHYLRVISESAKHMGNLIDHLLVFSRMGRTEMQDASVNLEDLTRDVIAELQTETRSRHIVWNNRRLPQVRGDPVMLRLVLINLLSNAVKYTGTRKRAEIEIGSTETPEEFIVFVRDNGVGFEMEYADKLFSVFQRLHRADEFEGTGVGLANVRRIVHRHGGRTWAEGKVNAGAAFFFSLPKNREARPAHTPADDAGSAEEPGRLP